VANAGGGSALAPLHQQDAKTFVDVLNLNVLGTMLTIKHSAPRMAAAGGGSFVGMSSIAGYVTHPFFGAYTAAKAGIEALVRNAADEYGPVGVRCNTIRPGFITTEVMAGIERGGAVWNSYVDQTPLGGVGEPEDVANLARFLLSDESRWITGVAIAVDGGHGLRRGPDFSTVVDARIDGATLRR
jgi:7-alpha-hydroxysteroid dehydrogenase